MILMHINAEAARSSAGPLGGSLTALHASPHAPTRKQGIDLRRDKEPGALRIVAFREQFVIFGERMARIGDERKPRCGFGRGGSKPRTVHRVIHDGAEFVRRNLWRELSQSLLDVGALGQFASRVPGSSYRGGWRRRLGGLIVKLAVDGVVVTVPDQVRTVTCPEGRRE